MLAFGIPVLSLLPIKLLAWYLFAEGHAAIGLGMIIAAKVGGTALAARLFQLTEPALMQLPWFARYYLPWKRWKDRMLAQLRGSAWWLASRQALTRGRLWGQRTWAALKASVS
ncbi:MAG: hypothetical protein JWQ72_1252 [Polaromonas sp.]|nr:hypothetical protein [Polaromonas sp.]